MAPRKSLARLLKSTFHVSLPFLLPPLLAAHSSLRRLLINEDIGGIILNYSVDNYIKDRLAAHKVRRTFSPRCTYILT